MRKGDVMIIVDYNKTLIAQGLWQYDFGQVLRIQGGNLAKAQEIHFSLDATGGDSVTRIGITQDGVTDVVIPDTMLINDETDSGYSIYVFIYKRDAESGETEKKITLKVKSRPKPEAFDTPEDKELFEEAIKAVKESAERAESAEKQAGEYAEQTKADAIKTGEDRTAIAELVESVSGIGEQVQAVKEYKDQAQTAATNALLSEQKSNEAKEAALQAQAGAETAADEAEQHALGTAGDKSEVERLATQVRQDKSSVEQTKTAVDKTAQDFTLTAQQALADVNNAGQTQSERVQQVGQDAIADVNTAKTQAVGEVNATKSNAVKAVQTEGEKQAQAVKAKGQEVINSIPQDFPMQMETKMDKQQGTENAGKALVIGEDGNVVPGEVQGGGVQPLKLLNTIDITQQVNKVQCDFPGEYDKYYVIGNCVIPEESTGAVVLYQFVKLADKTGSNLKFYDTYGNKGKTLNMSLTMERKKKEDGTYMIRMHGMYTTSDYTAGKIYRDNIDTGWVDKDIAGKKILKYTSISISAMINSGNLEIYGGA